MKCSKFKEELWLLVLAMPFFFTNHDWSPFWKEVVGQLSAFGSQFGTLTEKAKVLNESNYDIYVYLTHQVPFNSPPYKHDLGGHPKQVIQDILDLDWADPLPRSHKRRLFVSNIHQSLRRNNPPDKRNVKSTSRLRHHFLPLWTKPIPVGSPCGWELISPCSLAAWTRNRWSEVIGKRSPSRCRQCGPACSGGNCRCLEPGSPSRNIFMWVEQNSSSALSKIH